jgi:ABC-type bacteriocin/lantibiotic exporter with double-glycine peptidase domain
MGHRPELPAAGCPGETRCQRDLGAAFRFGEVLALVRDNLMTYLVLALMVWVAWVLASLGVVLCLVGWLFTIPYAIFVVSHLYDQACRRASGHAQSAATD